MNSVTGLLLLLLVVPAWAVDNAQVRAYWSDRGLVNPTRQLREVGIPPVGTARWKRVHLQSAP